MIYLGLVLLAGCSVYLCFWFAFKFGRKDPLWFWYPTCLFFPVLLFMLNVTVWILVHTSQGIK